MMGGRLAESGTVPPTIARSRGMGEDGSLRIAPQPKVTTEEHYVNTSQLLELAERCEREEPSDMLDWAIQEQAVDTPGTPLPVKPYTTSLDAAVTLVPSEGVAWWELSVEPSYPAGAGSRAEVFFDDERKSDTRGDASTSALALCAAALKARAAIAKRT